ncbi:MAG: hypothetical protein V4694_00980 [Pseudomonadota bacterium]
MAVFLFSLQIFNVFNSHIWRDDAFFAAVAKNLANGDGFSAVFFDQNYKFHFGISSGPLIILPAALMIFIFGNHYWVPGLTEILLIWSLLITIFIVADEIVGEKRKWAFGFFALIMSLLFASGDEVKLSLWHNLMGEVPAALLVVLAVLIFSAPKLNKARLAIAGTFLGLAIMAKMIAVIASSVVLAMVTIRILYNKKPLSWIAIPILCFLAPFLAFELSKIILLGWTGYLELQLQNSNFYQVNALIKKPFFTYVPELIIYFKIASLFFLPGTAYVIYYSLKKNPKSPYVLAGMTLLCIFCVHTTWWMIYSIPGAYRHFTVALICYFSGLFLLICKLDYKKPSQVVFISFFIGAFFVSGSIEKLSFFKSESNLQEQLIIIEAINNFQKQGVEIISCGNNFELEYLLPESRNFKECTNFFANNIPKKVMLINFFAVPEKVIFIRHDQYRGEFITLPNQILERCKEEYLTTENFSLLWCE